MGCGVEGGGGIAKGEGGVGDDAFEKVKVEAEVGDGGGHIGALCIGLPMCPPK